MDVLLIMCLSLSAVGSLSCCYPGWATWLWLQTRWRNTSSRWWGLRTWRRCGLSTKGRRWNGERNSPSHHLKSGPYYKCVCCVLCLHVCKWSFHFLRLLKSASWDFKHSPLCLCTSCTAWSKHPHSPVFTVRIIAVHSHHRTTVIPESHHTQSVYSQLQRAALVGIKHGQL